MPLSRKRELEIWRELEEIFRKLDLQFLPEPDPAPVKKTNGARHDRHPWAPPLLLDD